MPRKRRSYKRTPVKRLRTTKETRRLRRKQTENKFIDGLSKAIRLLILVAICGFIVYRLFLPEKKGQSKKVREEAAPPKVDMTVVEPVEKKVSIDTLSKDKALDYLVREVFHDYNLENAWIKRKGSVLEVQLPAELPAVTVIWDIIQKIEQVDLHVIKSEEDLKANKSSISIGTDKKTYLTIHFIRNDALERKTGKIAIIIDDLGYNDNKTTNRLLELDYPIALSIIPGQKHSTMLAKEAKQFNKTVMIHLPMEAREEQVEDGEYTIMTEMPDSTIANRVRKALAHLPEAIGVNNHMGSRATADSRVMGMVMNQLKSEGKFFVDSKTTDRSVVLKMAEKYHLKFAASDGFLERNRNEDEQYIQRKLAVIAKIAKKQGRAVVIGHPYNETIEVLAEELPKLEKQGFKIVPITDVIR